MITDDPKEAVETAEKVMAAYEEEGGVNADGHVDGFMSGVEEVLARPGVDRRAYLGKVVGALEGRPSSPIADALLSKLRSAQKAA